ncbi:MAG: glycosyltransferase family 2 protein [Thermodesulfobacteriota bacterium]
MTTTLQVIFWAGFAALAYSYIGYPLTLVALNKLLASRRERRAPQGCATRKVSLIVAAYNEEAVIEGKVANSLSLDYPPELIELWIASDGSTDRTNEIVRRLAGEDARVHLLEFPRTGKSGVINMAVERAGGEIIVFSDANTEFAPGALRKLVAHFDDDRVGCVGGRLIYRNPGEAVSGRGESFYWRYETALKKLENALGFVAGANGAIYAIRRSLFEPLAAGTINDDFVISMRIVGRGFKSVYEEEAVAYEDVAPNMESEFKRHVRDGAGHYIAVYHLAGLLNPLLGTRAFIYWSHRVLRWSAPFLMIMLFAVSVALRGGPLYANLLLAQTGFYTLAIAGLMIARYRSMPFFLYVPFYFCNLNLALLCGFVKAMTGTQKTTWERTERG